jgi:hypothetical protein
MAIGSIGSSMKNDTAGAEATSDRGPLYSAIFSGVLLLLAVVALLDYSFPIVAAIVLAPLALVLGLRVLLIRRAGWGAKVIAGIVSFFSVAMTALLILGLSSPLFFYRGAGGRSGSLSIIEEEAQLILPAGAELIHFEEPVVFIDPIWVAKVTVPAESIESLRQSLTQKGKEVSRAALSYVAESVDWWKPADVLLTVEYMGSGLITVFVSREGDGYALYIERVVF